MSKNVELLLSEIVDAIQANTRAVNALTEYLMSEQIEIISDETDEPAQYLDGTPVANEPDQ